MRTVNALIFQGSEESEAAVSDNQNQCSASGEETEKAYYQKRMYCQH